VGESPGSGAKRIPFEVRSSSLPNSRLRGRPSQGEQERKRDARLDDQDENYGEPESKRLRGSPITRKSLTANTSAYTERRLFAK
jgi:hypothetical protein